MTTKIRRQWSSLRLKVHPNRYYPDSVDRSSLSSLSIDSTDVVHCSLTKDINQAAGSFTLKLLPRQKYLQSIRPNDWLEIFLDNGDNPTSDEPTMVGSVDRISRQRTVVGAGSTQEVINISGRDYGKVFLKTVIVIDPLVGSIIDQATFEQEVIISQFSKNDIPLNGPSEVVKELLKRYHDKRVQCLLPPSLLKHGNLVTHLSDVRGQIVVNGNPNLGGNLWTTMEQYINPVLNEFWVDTVNGAPTLYLEERPFSHDKFAELDSVQVDESEVISEELGLSDEDTKNWIRLYPDAQFLPAELVNIAGLGYTNKASVQRSGLCKFEPTTNAFGDFSQAVVDVEGGIPSGTLQDWVGIIAEWNANNDMLLAGTMTTRLRTDARVGTRFDYTNTRTGEKLSFYIESISHNFVYPGASTTTFNLTRGVEREEGSALKFPLLKTLGELTLRDSELQLLTQLNLDDLENASLEAPVGTANV